MTLTSKLRSSSQRRHRQRGIGRLDPTWDARPINWRGPGVEIGAGHANEHDLAQNVARKTSIETGTEPRPAWPPGAPEPATPEPTQRIVQMVHGATPEPVDCAGPAEQVEPPADRNTNIALQARPAELRIAAPQANNPGDRSTESARDSDRSQGYDSNHTGLGAPQTAAASQVAGAASQAPSTSGGIASDTHWRRPAFDQTGNRATAAAPIQGGRAAPIAPGPIVQDRRVLDRRVLDRTLAQSRQKLIDDLRVMKRTRFNAQARFEAKHTASVSAFTLAAIVEIGLSLLGSNFGAGMAADVVSFIDYASQVTAVFILGFGLVVALAGHQTKALYLQRCAKDWGNLSREMQIAGPITRARLQDYRRRYHEIEGRCPPNHADVDLDKARLDKSDRKAVRDNKLDYLIDVYLSYAVSGLALTAFWIALWHFMVS